MLIGDFLPGWRYEAKNEIRKGSFEKIPLPEEDLCELRFASPLFLAHRPICAKIFSCGIFMVRGFRCQPSRSGMGVRRQRAYNSSELKDNEDA